MRLAAAIAAARARPFAWGANDCVTWAADVRLALTGEDLATGWRGRYSTPRGAARLIRRMGFRSLTAAVTAALGAPLPSVLMAQRGDVVREGAVEAFGICAGRMALFLSPDGLTERPIEDCGMAWRV